jgi:hypothetical protein
VRVAYGGQEALTFMDYTDLETGRTLHAEPGGVYDITPVSGRVVDEVPAPWFTPVDPDAWAAEQAAREAARLAAEGAAGDSAEPETQPETQPAEG